MWCLRAPGRRPNRPRRPRPSRKPPPPRPSARPASASRSAVPASRRSPRSRWRAMTSRSRSRDASRAGSSSPRARRSAASARLAATFASDGYAFRRSSLHLRHPREAFRGREKRDWKRCGIGDLLSRAHVSSRKAHKLVHQCSQRSSQSCRSLCMDLRSCTELEVG